MPITWITKHLLKTSHAMNPIYSSGQEGAGTLGGWHKTKMYSYIQETLKSLFPANLLEGIKEVRKSTREYSASGSSVSNAESAEKR